MHKVIFSLILLTSIGCSKTSTFNNVKVSIDPRIELVLMACILNEYEEFSLINSAYVSRVKDYFNNYKNDEFITFFSKIRNNGMFSFDAPIKLALALDENTFSLNQNININKLYNDEKYIIDFEYFGKISSEFCKRTNAIIFFKNLNALVDQSEQSLKVLLESEQITEFFTQYFNGKSLPNIIYSPLLNNSNFGISIKTKSNEMESYILMGSSRSRDIFIHEASHIIFNPLIDRIWETKKESISAIYKYIESKMKNLYYGHEKIYFYESVVRANEIVFYKKNNYSYSEILTKKYNEMGFELIEELSFLIQDSIENSNFSEEIFIEKILSNQF